MSNGTAGPPTDFGDFQSTNNNESSRRATNGGGSLLAQSSRNAGNSAGGVNQSCSSSSRSPCSASFGSTSSSSFPISSPGAHLDSPRVPPPNFSFSTDPLGLNVSSTTRSQRFLASPVSHSVDERRRRTAESAEPDDPCSSSTSTGQQQLSRPCSINMEMGVGEGSARAGEAIASPGTPVHSSSAAPADLRLYPTLSPPATPTNSIMMRNLSSTASVRSTGSSHSSTSLMRLPPGSCCSSSSNSDAGDVDEFLEEIGDEETDEEGMEEQEERGGDTRQGREQDPGEQLPEIATASMPNRTPKSSRSRHRSMMAETPSSSRSSPGCLSQGASSSSLGGVRTPLFGGRRGGGGGAMAASPRCRLSYIRRDACRSGADGEAAHERLTKASQQVSTIFDEFGLDEAPAAEERKRARSLTEPISILTNAFLPQSCSPSPTRVDTQKQCYSPSTQQVVRSNIPYSPCPSPTPNASPTRSRIMRSLSPIAVRQLSKRRYTTSSSSHMGNTSGAPDSDGEIASGYHSSCVIAMKSTSRLRSWAAKRVCPAVSRNSCTSPLVNERLTPYSFPSPGDAPSPIGFHLLPASSSSAVAGAIFERPHSRSSSDSSSALATAHSSSSTTIVSEIFGQPATTIITSNGGAGGGTTRYALLLDPAIERQRFALPVGHLGGGPSSSSTMDSDAESGSAGAGDDDTSIPDAPADPSPSTSARGEVNAASPIASVPTNDETHDGSNRDYSGIASIHDENSDGNGDLLLLDTDESGNSSLVEPPPDPPMDQG